MVEISGISTKSQYESIEKEVKTPVEYMYYEKIVLIALLLLYYDANSMLENTVELYLCYDI